MDRLAEQLKAELTREAARLELRMAVRRAGSLMNVEFAAESPEEAARMHRNFHLASLNHGAFIAPRGLIALSTVITDELMTEICERFSAAMADVAASG
jgi:glutamate-1-semialdehyde aminotransferase